MAECPYIDKAITNPVFNKPMTYISSKGVGYTYYLHNDGFGKYTKCQFCLVVGRKQDVFECLDEWQWCKYYKSKEEQ